MKNGSRRKIVLVTGGSKGIGKSIALKFARNGCDVAVTYNTSTEKAKKVLDEMQRAGSRAALIQADFLEPGAIEKVYHEFDRHYDRLDVLVNNAGWTKYIPHENLDDITDEFFDKIMTINLKSVFFCTRYAARRMKADGGCIINITSTAAYNGIGSNIAYCAAKAGVRSITKSYARVLGPKIRVNAVAPGLTETEMTLSGPPSYRTEQINSTPLGRIAKPEDIADAVYAVANDIKFINGKTIIVDGGRLL
jgi:3-oxoacyl-[acyl-carrier protein] reductase